MFNLTLVQQTSLQAAISISSDILDIYIYPFIQALRGTSIRGEIKYSYQSQISVREANLLAQIIYFLDTHDVNKRTSDVQEYLHLCQRVPVE
jgi:hypothetical protein